GGPAGTPPEPAAPVVASAPDQAPAQRETTKPSRDETAAAPGRSANPASAPVAVAQPAAPVADPAPRIQVTLAQVGTPAPPVPVRPVAVPLPPPPRPAAQVTVPLVNEGGMAGRLRLSLRGEVLHATIFAADRATAGALRDGLGDLRRGLAERGFADAHVAVREGPAAPDLKHTPSRDPARDHSSDPHTPEEHRRDDRSGTLPRDGRRRSPREGAERQDR
ncbi:MAG: flagellar hook-length control protein FliK, partial [Gemmatimonadales bacterium]